MTISSLRGKLFFEIFLRIYEKEPLNCLIIAESEIYMMKRISTSRHFVMY